MIERGVRSSPFIISRSRYVYAQHTNPRQLVSTRNDERIPPRLPRPPPYPHPNFTPFLNVSPPATMPAHDRVLGLDSILFSAICNQKKYGMKTPDTRGMGGGGGSRRGGRRPRRLPYRLFPSLPPFLAPTSIPPTSALVVSIVPPQLYGRPMRVKAAACWSIEPLFLSLLASRRPRPKGCVGDPPKIHNP